MSLLNIFTRKAPTFGTGDNVLEFDAVLEDTLEASVTFTQFPIELGATASDHGIVQPFRWRMTGAISNNPVKVGFGDLASGFVSNFVPDGIAQTAVSATAGFLAGGDGTRASSALDVLINLMRARQPFDIDAGDIQLVSMVITNITRTKDPENEDGLIFVADLQELPLLSTVISNQQPTQDELNDNDPSKSQAASDVNKGEVLPVPVTVEQIERVRRLVLG